MDKIIRQVAKLMQPHMSKVIGVNRPAATPWREDSRLMPPFKPFDSAVLRDYDFSKNKDMRRPFRILSLDGGGIRGILTIAILARISEHNPRFLDNVDFIAGTSVGGIISLLLASGYSPRECDDIYGFAATHIFGHNPWRVINPWRSKYSDKAKQELFQHFFGERVMGDLEKCTAVVAFRLDGHNSNTHSFFNKEGWRPAVFSNMPMASGHVMPDSDLKVWDAAMRTSAAPTFFPVFKGYTDGGIVANNPSILAVSKAMAHFSHLTPRNVVVLSLGAGTYPRFANVFSAGTADVVNKHDSKKERRPGDSEYGQMLRADWGIKQWVPFLLDLLLDGDGVTTEMVMHYLLGGHKLYHRLDPRLPREIGLDDVSALEELRAFAQTVDISETLKFVDDNFTDDVGQTHEDNMGYNSLDHASDYHNAWENMKEKGSKQQGSSR